MVKAIAWMIDGGTKGTGLPYRLQCTYDQLFLNLYDHNTFNSFLYVLALRAAKELCKIMDDLDLLKEVSTALKIANYRISEELWSEEDGYYHAWWDKEKGSPSWLMSDSLYAQVWAFTLGLGHLDDPTRLGCNFRFQDNLLLRGLSSVASLDNDRIFFFALLEGFMTLKLLGTVTKCPMTN